MYNEGLVEEAAYLLAEWLASKSIQGTIAFPELVVPIVVVLRKALKSAKSPSHSKNVLGKDVGVVKGLVERIEESSKWVEERRSKVRFGPGMLGEVGEWEESLNVDETPLAKYLKVQRKARDKRKQLVEKVFASFRGELPMTSTENSTCRLNKAKTRSWKTEDYKLYNYRAILVCVHFSAFEPLLHRPTSRYCWSISTRYT